MPCPPYQCCNFPNFAQASDMMYCSRESSVNFRTSQLYMSHPITCLRMATTAWFGLELTGRVGESSRLVWESPKSPWARELEPSTAANPGDSELGGFLRLDFFCSHTRTHPHMHSCLSSALSRYWEPPVYKKRMSVASLGSHALLPLVGPGTSCMLPALSLGWESQALVPRAAWHWFSSRTEVLKNRSHSTLFETRYSTFKTYIL